MAFRIVIPARYGSSRLPGKPLVRIADKPLVAHVYARACASAATAIVIATDDMRIAEVAVSLGSEVCITGSHHQSGSDRVAEVLTLRNWPDDTCVVNLQGDEPCMPPALINQVAQDLQAHSDAAMATLATPLLEPQSIFDPNVVKVVTDANSYAMYFSRAPIPWQREAFRHQTILNVPAKITDNSVMATTLTMQRHIGLYAYRAGFLRRYVSWPPCPIERAESLEQLRALWHGERVYVGTATQTPGPGVDVPDDVAKVEALLSSGDCPKVY